MNYFSKIIIAVLVIPFTAAAMSPQDAIAKNPLLKGLIESVKRTNTIGDSMNGVVVDVIDPSDELLTIAHRALKNCGITQDVIVLELKKVIDCEASQSIFPATGVWYYTDHSLAARFLFVVNNRADAELEGWLYHECGHIYYDHSDKHEKTLALCNFALVTTGFVWCYQQLDIPQYARCILIGLGINGFKWLSDLFVDRFAWKFYERYCEKSADRFACEHLLQNKKYDSFIANLKYFVDVHESGARQYSFGWSSTHPTHYERAKIGLQILIEHNLSVEALLNDEQVQKLYDEDTRTTLLLRIRNLFPELV